jgi:hypothetical protein
MNINRLLQLTTQHVDLIAGYDATDIAVRNAALDKVLEHINHARGDMQAKLDDTIATSLEAPPASLLEEAKPKRKH